MRRVVLITVCVILGLLASCVDPAKKSADLVREAKKLIYDNKSEEALALIDEAIDIDPSNASAYYYRGTIMFNKKDYDAARSNYDKAIELDPTFAQAYVNRGNLIFMLTTDRSQACDDWVRAEELGVPNLDDKTRQCR